MSAKICPKCHTPLVFTPDGRARICERCGYREAAQTASQARPSVAELARALADRRVVRRRDDSSISPHSLVGIGRNAVKAGNKDEAFYYLKQALQADPSPQEGALAWVWLSQVYDDPAEKRACLEQAITLHPTNPLARRGLAILDGRLQANEIVDPNEVQRKTAAPGEPRAISPEQFQCPRCAARMNYTPDGRSLRCDFCGYTQSLAEPGSQVQADYGIGGAEQDFIAALATARGHIQPVASRAFQCAGCGVEFVLGPETLSVTCPYCGSVYVTKAAETRQIHPPQALIPFVLNEDDARRAVYAWLKQRKVTRARFSPFVGIYLPLWTFDIGGSLNWRGYVEENDGGELFSSGQRSRRLVSGSKAIFYDDVLIPATEKLPKLLPKLLETFDYAQLVAYDGRYLADWPAERYQLTLADASLQARKQIIREMRRRPDRLTGGQPVQNLTVSSGDMLVESFKLLLVPVWIARYKVEGKVYHALVNGQTGEIAGTRPRNVLGRLMSWVKGD